MPRVDAGRIAAHRQSAETRFRSMTYEPGFGHVRRLTIRPLSSTSRARPPATMIRPILTWSCGSTHATRMPCNKVTGVIVRLMRRISSRHHARCFQGANGLDGQGTQSDAGGGGGTSRRVAARTGWRIVWNGTVPIGSSSSAILWASMSRPVNPHPPIPRRAGWREYPRTVAPCHRRRVFPCTTIPRSCAPTVRSGLCRPRTVRRPCARV